MNNLTYISFIMCSLSFKYPSRRSRGLMGGSMAARLLGLGLGFESRRGHGCLSLVCVVRFLRQADHSYRELLTRNLTEEA